MTAKKNVEVNEDNICPVQAILIDVQYDVCEYCGQDRYGILQLQEPRYRDHSGKPSIACDKPIRKSGIRSGKCKSGSCGDGDFWYCTREHGHVGPHEAITSTGVRGHDEIVVCRCSVKDVTADIEKESAVHATL